MTDQNNGNYVAGEPVNPPVPDNGQPQQAPPQYQQAPPQYQQAPPQYQQAPPQYQQAPPQYQQAPPQYQQAPPQYQQTPPQYQQAPPQYQQAPPQAGPIFSPVDVEAGKVLAILGYIFPILFFLPLVSGVKTPYAMFHANNALVILIGYVIGSVLTLIFIGFLVNVFLFVLCIMGIVAACNGSAKPMPVIGGMRILK